MIIKFLFISMNFISMYQKGAQKYKIIAPNLSVTSKEIVRWALLEETYYVVRRQV